MREEPEGNRDAKALSAYAGRYSEEGFTPYLGYTDDLGILTAAVVAVAAHIKEEHRGAARRQVASWMD